METLTPTHVREERKVVTAVFADIVGSTRLAERLDAEDVKLVVGDAIARIVVEVEALGGHVKDLAGDGVLAFFGAPVAYEDDAERAVRAGLRVVEQLAPYGADVERGWGVEGFSVRVGISTGPVVLGLVGAGRRVEYGAFGDTVNTAARIQASAAPGSVLVDETTRRLVEPLFEWGDAVSLDLKGKSQAVRAHTVARPVAGARNRRGLGDERARLVGREHELAEGLEALDELADGTGFALFITGEAGIGKSRLLLELREAFESSRPQRGRPLWLEGRCLSYGETLPYWPFRDLLRNEWLGVGHDEPELRVRVALRRRLEDLFGDAADDLYPYLCGLLALSLEPEPGARLAELSPEALRYRTFEVVETLLARLARDGPVVLAVEDMHWADATSVELSERLLRTCEEAAVGLVVAQRDERDHQSWGLRECAAREFPHLFRELPLEPLTGDAQRELLTALVGSADVPAEIERRLLDAAEGNPFYLEELVSSLADTGALVRENGGWRFDRAASVEVPQTVEKVIIARIDRLAPRCRHVLTAASALGRRFGLPLLEGVLDGDSQTMTEALHELQRVELIQSARRWPEPEFRFKHTLIQETAYRTLLSEPRAELHRRAAEWLEERYAEREEEVLGLLAHHWLAAAHEDKAVDCHMRAGDRARQKYALDEAIEHYEALLELLERRGEQQAMALVLFKLALALHTSLRFAEANAAYARAFATWTPDEPPAGPPTATVRVATSFLPNDADPKSAIAWPNIQLCMQLFDRLVEAWPERTIVPSLAERWEISDDGLRYVFHLRDGLRWSDGEPLTAADVEFGIKRVLDPDSPGSSVAIYFVLENGQDYYLRRNTEADRIGVKALDERTLEFRLVAPAPYFMSVMNRPDAAPAPRHAIEREGDAWSAPGRQVVSGPFRQEDRGEGRVVLARREDYAGDRRGNVGRIELYRASIEDALAPFERDDLDMVAVRYTPRIADFMTSAPASATVGPAGWSFYVSFDHTHPVTSRLAFRRALAHAVDRDELDTSVPFNLVVATGGIVPPALQGHTPDIALGFDPERARSYLAESGVTEGVALGAFEGWASVAEALAELWERTLGLRFAVEFWTADAPPPPSQRQPLLLTGWLPGYPDPEYFLRLLLHSESKTNEGGFEHEGFDALIERARQERRDSRRLELFHEADRLVVADQVAVVPIAYGRSMALVKPRVSGWWEFAKTSASFADLVVGER